MKTKCNESLICPKMVVLQVEEMLDFMGTSFDLGSKKPRDEKARNQKKKDIYLALDSLYGDESKPKYKLLEIARFAIKQQNEIAMIIAEIDYFKEIDSITDPGEIDEIKSVVIFSVIAYTKCGDKINAHYEKAMLSTDNMANLETLLSRCPEYCPAYSVGINKLIKYYEKIIDKKYTSAEIEDFVNEVKRNKGIHLNTTESGKDFLKYCKDVKKSLFHKEKLARVAQSNSLDEILAIRDDAIKHGSSIASICNNKLAILVKEVKTSTSEDGLIDLFKYLVQPSARKDLLMECLSRLKDDSIHNGFVYKMMLKEFPEDYDNIKIAREKVIKLFHIKTNIEKSFAEACSFICHITNDNYLDRTFDSITNDITVKNTLIDRVNKASIAEIIGNIQILSACNNEEIFDAAIERFFSLEPSVSEISLFNMSLWLFDKSFPEVRKKFNQRMNKAFILHLKNARLSRDELRSEFGLIKNNPDCYEAQKAIIKAASRLHS